MLTRNLNTQKHRSTQLTNYTQVQTGSDIINKEFNQDVTRTLEKYN